MTQNQKPIAEMSVAEMKAEIEKLQAAQKAATPSFGGLSLRVSEKGGLSIYGLGRFPVTLYREQWAKLLGIQEHIVGFIASHSAELKTKPAKETPSAKAELVDSPHSRVTQAETPAPGESVGTAHADEADSQNFTPRKPGKGKLCRSLYSCSWAWCLGIAALV